MSFFVGTTGTTGVWFSGLSRRPLRVALTILGIAAGVALSFSVAAQNASLTRGSADAYRALAGDAQIEVSSLGVGAITDAVLARVRRVSRVAAAVPFSDDMVTLHIGRHTLDVRLIGADDRARALGGRLAHALNSPSRSLAIGLYLPAKVGTALHLKAGASVVVRARIGARTLRVLKIVPDRQLGSLASAPVVFAPLPLAQLFAGVPGRSQRILVVTKGQPRRDLYTRLQAAGGRGTVARSTEEEIRSLEQASALNRSSSLLFATLSLVVGGLLAYAAMILTMAERRRDVATLRALGCGTGALFCAVLFDAAVLGAAGTALGLIAGRLALGWLLPADNSLLATAFMLSTRSVVPATVIVLSCVAGVATAALAAILPARTLSKIPPAAALHRESDATVVAGNLRKRLLLLLAIGFGASGVIATIAGFGMVGLPLWIFAGLLCVPVAVPVTARALQRLIPGPAGAVAVGISEVAAFPSRAIAAAAVVALSVSGLIVINGAVSNLETGTAKLAASSYPPGDLFVTVAAQHEVFFTRPFAARLGAPLRHLPAVESVRPWRFAFLDWDGRRVLAFAFTDGAPRPFRAGELVKGDERAAAAKLATERDAAAVSSDLAAARGLRVGDRFEIPTPRGPRRVRVVALITNYGWVPGALALNDRAMAAWWGTTDATALQVQFSPGTDRAVEARRVSAALSGTGLKASTSPQLLQSAGASARSQLANLRRIGELIALAGLLAVTAATLAAVLGRIRRVSALRTVGMSLAGVGVALCSEVACVVGIGALIGSITGVVGQDLVVRSLASTFAMAVAFQPSASQLVAALGVSAATVLSATLVALRWAATAPLAMSMREI